MLQYQEYISPMMQLCGEEPVISHLSSEVVHLGVRELREGGAAEP